MVSQKDRGLVVALIGAILAAVDGTFGAIDIRGLGIVIVIIGLILYISEKR